jgi:hypothetical protein
MTGAKAGYPEGCSNPSEGMRLEAYLDRALSTEHAAAFEAHYFACAACAREIEFRVTVRDVASELPEAEAVVPRWRTPAFRWSALSAMGVAVLVLVAFLGPWGPRNGRGPLTLDLYETVRGGQVAVGTAGTPLRLRFHVDAPDIRGVKYSIVVTGPDDRELLSAADFVPTSRELLEVEFPEGLSATGSYRANVTEHLPGAPPSNPRSFDFEIGPAGSP